MKPGKLPRNNQISQYLSWATTVYDLLFCAHTLRLNYVAVTILLVSLSGTNHDLLCLCTVMAKKANKKNNFAKLNNNSPLLTITIFVPFSFIITCLVFV